MVIAMIPARMGSQRLKQKNLRRLAGTPLITRAIRKCKLSGVFDSIWVNSENQVFGEIAAEENVCFHKRPSELADNHSTSEQFVAEFLQVHDCDFVVQVHSIAPLLTVAEIRNFVNVLKKDRVDCLLSADEVQIECTYRDKPVNFSFAEKTNSQDLVPVQRLSWSITAWRRSAYLAATAAGTCATYAGRVGFHPVSSLAGHVIKTERDLRIAEALLPLVEDLPE
jgi:CMP-N-acetylneuraminic acid synthetase